jgi:hypothetical protein
MLDDQNIARHQVRASDARQLVIGEIPRFHAEQHTQRFALYDCFTFCYPKLSGSQKARGVIGIVVQYVRAQLDLGLRLAEQLPHLKRDGHCEFIKLVTENRRGFLTIFLRSGKDLSLQSLS